MTQDAAPLPRHDRANLSYAKPDATDPEIWAALDGAQVGRSCADLPDGLDTLVGERGVPVLRRREAAPRVARLLLKAPIVVLDEETAHLDSESEAAVQRALRSR